MPSTIIMIFFSKFEAEVARKFEQFILLGRQYSGSGLSHIKCPCILQYAGFGGIRAKNRPPYKIRDRRR